MKSEESTLELMQAIAEVIDSILTEATGEKGGIGFILVAAGLSDTKSTNYIGNVKREDGIVMLESTAARFKKEHALEK